MFPYFLEETAKTNQTRKERRDKLITKHLVKGKRGLLVMLTGKHVRLRNLQIKR
jgi:hypothetical protein